MNETDCDVAVVGAGAAGLLAAIFAGRSGARVIALEGAGRIGAKILISGGGRCNVTHDVVTAADFNGSRNAIAKVLRTFDVGQTIEFFEEIGVPLKREETGKLFPGSDRARTVVDGLVRATEDAGVELRTNARVEAIEQVSAGLFLITTSRTSVRARRVVIATGGRSVPKTGSDGFGYELVRRLGHTTEKTFPALVPLILDKGHWLTSLSGSSVVAELIVRTPTGAVLQKETGSMLFTHFGLSGPVVLDISRHWVAHRPAVLVANLLPGATFESVDAALVREAKKNPHATVASYLRAWLPERLAEALGREPLGRLTKEERRRVVRSVVELPLPVTADRGFDYAEVTAGGVPLAEVDVATMASRRCPGLYLCGEILDVDGKIGGYNFQWAWATGRLAGASAAVSLSVSS
jgi:predicted Rossmann fold flavoprotein